MAEVLLFHHAQGLTSGVRALADDLRAAGHVVHTPDLYDGRTFPDLAAGVQHAQQLGFDTVVERGRRAAEPLPADLVHAGMSLGVLPAQSLAQNRPGARAALLLHACVPPAELGGPWPPDVPLQIHVMADDEQGDVDVAREMAAQLDRAELFLYPGDRHLFSDRSLPDHDEDASALLTRRVLAFLDAVSG